MKFYPRQEKLKNVYIPWVLRLDQDFRSSIDSYQSLYTLAYQSWHIHLSLSSIYHWILVAGIHYCILMAINNFVLSAYLKLPMIVYYQLLISMMLNQALVDYVLSANWSSVVLLYQHNVAAVIQLQVRTSDISPHWASNIVSLPRRFVILYHTLLNH